MKIKIVAICDATRNLIIFCDLTESRLRNEFMPDPRKYAVTTQPIGTNGSSEHYISNFLRGLLIMLQGELFKYDMLFLPCDIVFLQRFQLFVTLAFFHWLQLSSTDCHLV